MRVKRLDVVLSVSCSLWLHVAACTGQIDAGGASSDSPGGGGGQTGTSSPGSTGGKGTVGGPGEGPAASACTGRPSAGPAPLRRLTGTEYHNTMRDLLGGNHAVSVGFTDDEIVAGFAANAVAPVDRLQVEDYRAAATALAASATADVQRFTSCTPSDLACLRTFVRTFAARAWRRPLTEIEAGRYDKLFADSAMTWGPQTGLRLTIEALLQSPHFLYHVPSTREAADPNAVVRLDDMTIASRLSYLIWQSLPDDELRKAAEQGLLSTAAGLQSQVERLLTSPRAHEGIRTFHLQWLGVESLRQATKDPALFPDWNSELAQAMVDDVSAAVGAAFVADGGRLSTLMTRAEAFGESAALKRVYGVTGQSDSFMPVADERAGLLTRPAVLARYAHAAEGSWTERGKFVRERLLCQTIPAPPPTVVIDEPGNDPSRLKDPKCSGCHRLMDPLGQGFDQYDAIGALTHRTVSGQGALWDAPAEDLEGTFEGPVELAAKLSQSPHVMSCMVRQWFRFALKRLEQLNDACTLETIGAQFAASDGVTTALIAALATADSLTFAGPESEEVLP